MLGEIEKYSRAPHIAEVDPDSEHGRRYSYLLIVPATHSHSGKRIRRYFKNKCSAELELARINKLTASLGKRSSTLPPAALSDFHAARAILEESGANISIADAVRGYLRFVARRKQSKTVSEAVGEWRAAPTPSGTERRKASQVKVDTLAKQLAVNFGDAILAEIQPEKLVEFLEDLSETPAAFNKRLILIGGFLRFAEKRGWCTGILLQRIQAHKKRVPARESKPGILTPEQFRLLLEKADMDDSSLVDYLAVLGLAGVRPDEAARLTFADFKPEAGSDGVILIPDGAAKTRRGRDVPMRPALRLWLERKGGFYERAKENSYPDSEPLVNAAGGVLQRLLGRARNRSGWNVRTKGMPTPSKNAPQFPPDSLRHTFASAYIAEGGDISQLIFSFGHAAGIQTLRRHYLHRYTAQEANAWFSTIPAGSKLPPSLRLVPSGSTQPQKQKRKAV
jgi:integrase